MIPLLIIGTGFSGLGLAIKLRQQGREDFQVVERCGEVGGTWRDNTYPGCACDVPSHLYSFSFAPNPDWSKSYSPQPEILKYLKECADRYDVRRFIKFNTTVRSMKWTEGSWLVETSDGEIRAKSVAMAVGPLSEPSIPQLQGLADFKGPVFHSAEWDRSFDATGKKIGVIGNGASAVQFIPILQKQAEKLIVFQRTAAWVVPRSNRAFSGVERNIYRTLPFTRLLQRRSIFWLRELLSVAFRHPRIMRVVELISLKQLAKDVPDETLRKKLTPTYTIGCKRILLSDDYWPALAQSNVTVETRAIDHVDAKGIVLKQPGARAVATTGALEMRPGGQQTTGDQSAADHTAADQRHDCDHHNLDAIIFATGFHVTDLPFYKKVRGEGGQSLSDVWQGSPRAYMGTMAHGFPNLFMLLGPNTGLGHTSVVLMIEAQIDHVIQLLKQIKTKNTIEPRQDAQDSYNRSLDKEMKNTVWARGGCDSWYIDRTGRNSTIWPKSVVSFQKMIHAHELDGYQET